MPVSVMRSNSQSRPSLNRRRGTGKHRLGNSRMLMILFSGLALIGSLVLGIFIGILLFANPEGATSGVGQRVDSPTGLLRGVHLKEQWQEKTEKFKSYLHRRKEHGNEVHALLEGDFPYLGSNPPHNYNIAASWKPLGGNRYIEYTDGSSPYPITERLIRQSDDLARARRSYVKQAMEFAWDGYKNYAFGMDEILPASRRGTNNWGGFGVTLVDTLDTLWFMGMKDEFYEARDWVRDSLRHDKSRAVSVFETTIRSVGGLLSAYDWSGDKVFLDSALDLGSRLIRSFDNSPTGIPFGQVNLATGAASNIPWAGNNAILAEFGTLQLEFRWLDTFVNTPETAEMRRKVERVFEILHQMSPSNGLYPYYMKNQNSGSPTFANNHLTFGAMADSFYEYMLKVWIQGGKVEPMYREMYDKAMQGMHDELLQISEPSGLYYIADKTGHMIDHKQDHLVCFMGGLLALGAYSDPLGLDSDRAQRDLQTGRALAYTCYQTYARMATGISPEYVQFYKGDDFRIGAGAPHYLLRPETVESFFILNHLTKDPVYREWGWEVFQSIEKYCKTGVAYGTIKDVSNTKQQPNDKMETFFLAETMKYLYLLFDPDTEVDLLEKHVFNTEAHPIRVFSKIKQGSR